MALRACKCNLDDEESHGWRTDRHQYRMSRREAWVDQDEADGNGTYHHAIRGSIAVHLLFRQSDAVRAEPYILINAVQFSCTGDGI